MSHPQSPHLRPSSTVSTISTTTSTPLLPLHDSKRHLLLCSTGSVATIKLPNIINSLSHHTDLSVRVILTPSASHFLSGASAEQPTLSELSALPNVDGVYFDEDEWNVPWVRGNKILHIELRRWAHVMVIAPLSANSLAKIVNGWADNLLLSTVRAWDATGEVDSVPEWLPDEQRIEEERNDDDDGEVVGEGEVAVKINGYRKGALDETKRRRRKKVIVVAPSMNTAMWKQPITKKQIEVLEGEWGVKNGGWFEVLQPMEKELACGDVGGGAMKDWRDIVKVIERRLGLDKGDRKR